MSASLPDLLLAATRYVPGEALRMGVDLSADLTPRDLHLITLGQRCGIRAATEAHLASLVEPTADPEPELPACMTDDGCVICGSGDAPVIDGPTGARYCGRHAASDLAAIVAQRAVEKVLAS